MVSDVSHVTERLGDQTISDTITVPPQNLIRHIRGPIKVEDTSHLDQNKCEKPTITWNYIMLWIQAWDKNTKTIIVTVALDISY